MDAAAETLPGDVAAAMLAEPDGRWAVELHVADRAQVAAARDLVTRIAGRRAALTVATVAPQDWIKASLAGLDPVPAGRFVVHGGHDRARVAANQIAIEIEAALAFGTGHHGTTRGCLLALNALVKRAHKRPLARRSSAARILDIGTGSGVLAIAAAKALRRPVVASDIDKAAVVVARDNMRLNRTAPLVATVHAAGLLSPRIRARGPYGLVFANILLAPLRRLAAPMARILVPGARVILSGLLRQQANSAMAIYRAHGLRLECRLDLDGWVTLVMARAVAPPQPDP